MTLVEHVVDHHYRAIQMQPIARQRVEVASIRLETGHLPETYSYLLTPNGLLDPHTGRKITDFMEQDTYVGKVEYSAFQQIQSSAIQNMENPLNWTAIWISPPHKERSADTKIIFNKIVQTQLGLAIQNHCLLFEGNPYLSLNIANKILHTRGSMREPFVDTEVLRGSPLIYRRNIDLSTIYSHILEVVQSDGLNALKNGQAEAIQAEAESWASSYLASKRGENIRIRPIVAVHAVSCPSGMTASEVMIIGGEVHKFVHNCGQCGTPIKKFIKAGYPCETCHGVYRGC